MAKSNKNQLRVGVVGMGPVGSTLAAHLIGAGAFVVPCDIDREKIDKIKKAGIRLQHAIQKEVEIIEACYSAEELETYDLDLVAISVKTPNLEEVISQLAAIDSGGTFLMSAQNGLDNELEVAKVFGADRTLRMVVNYAGNMSDPNTVFVSFFNPPNYVAAITPRGETIAKKFVELLSSVDMKTEIPADIKNYIWEKAILNAALAPVCAIARQTMKEVMDSPHGMKLVEAIIDESVQVAEAEGIELGQNFRRFCVQYLQRGGHHRPSMLVDLENGLPTEIDRMNGKIAEYGHKHDLPTPINRSVTALVHMLEQSKR